MQQRAKGQRHSKKQRSSPPPKLSSSKESTLDRSSDKHRSGRSPSPTRELRKVRSHPRKAHPYRDWAADWEKHSNSASPIGSPAGLLHVRTRSGWTSQTWVSQSEELDPVAAEEKSIPESTENDCDDGLAELLFLKTELQKLHEGNAKRRKEIVSQLQELVNQRSDIYRGLKSVHEAEGSSSSHAVTANEQIRSQERIQEELGRLANEIEFKDQVSEMMRTILLKTKGQRTKLKALAQLDTGLSNPAVEISIHDSSKSYNEERQVDSFVNEQVKDMEKEIADLEGHLKLLNDALDDEKQDNYELAKENASLKEQVKNLTQNNDSHSNY